MWPQPTEQQPTEKAEAMEVGVIRLAAISRRPLATFGHRRPTDRGAENCPERGQGGVSTTGSFDYECECERERACERACERTSR